jgi:hypothetical protein
MTFSTQREVIFGAVRRERRRGCDSILVMWSRRRG